MSARYWVAITDAVMASIIANPDVLPDGLSLVEPDEYDLYCELPDPPGASWQLFDDDGAPASLGYKHVKLTFVRSGGKTMIGSRSPAV